MAGSDQKLSKPTLDKDLERLHLMEASSRFLILRGAAPGAALIFIAVAALLSAIYSAANPAALAIVVASAVAAYMAMNIGANDVTNNVGAAVGARALTMVAALTIAFVCEIAGAFLAGGNVVQTVKDIVDPASVGDPDTIVMLMAAALLAAALWVNIATWVNAPVSTTHSIIGAILGAGTAAAGAQAVNWSIMGSIAASWVVSPLMGATIAVGFLWFIKDNIIYREDKIAGARLWVPILLALMSGVSATYLLLVLGQRYQSIGLGMAVAAGFVAGLPAYFVLRAIVHRQATGLENRNASLRVLFQYPLIFSAGLLSFAHGANDVANAIGPLATIVEAAGLHEIGSVSVTPLWVTAIGAFGISMGLALFGPRLIRVVGSQITKLNPVRAFCVAMAAAITVIIASALGLPVSTTHVVVGAVFGVGLFREWYTARAARRRNSNKAEMAQSEDEGLDGLVEAVAGKSKGASKPKNDPAFRHLVRRSYIASILAAWLVTVPVSAGLGAGLTLLILNLTG